ncbi:hypothetical protein ACEPAF_1631 [Sanghuangporus sanghuang]
MSTEYCLRVISLDGLKWKPILHGKVPSLYVAIRLGTVTKKTRVYKKCLSPTWNDVLIFSSPDESSDLEMQVKHSSRWLPDPSVGYINIKFVDLLEKCTKGEVALSLLPCRRQATMRPFGEISLHLEVTDTATAGNTYIKGAEEDVHRHDFEHSAELSNILEKTSKEIALVSSGGELYQAIGDLLSKLAVLQHAMDVLSEIHPFLTIAWSLASALFTAARNVFETDQKVIDLVHKMSDAFAFARDIQALPNKASSLLRPIGGLLKQTIECCLFVRRYTSRNFVGRMLDMDSRRKVDEFGCMLENFRKEIDSGVILHTAVISIRTSGWIDSITLRQTLNPSLNDAFDRPICLPETRIEIRRQIIEWIFSGAPCSPELIDKLSSFTYQHLLFWFEALSLLRMFARVAGDVLTSAAAWVEARNANLASFLRDASKLATVFSLPIMQSTPHIYISMVPFSENESPVSAHYARYMTSMVQVNRIGVNGPPKIWDAHTGESNFAIKDAHADAVLRIGLSPDGASVASCSIGKSIKIWDISSGELISGPLHAHSGIVESVVFSPDNTRLASCSWDKTIIIWDTETWQPVSEPLLGHTDNIYCICFSPGGLRIASGSADKSVIVWDARRGNIITGPLVGHKREIFSLIFSLDGSYVISGSRDNTIRIWNVQNGQLICDPLEGHSSAITTLALSPDGSRIASGAFDTTIREWDISDILSSPKIVDSGQSASSSGNRDSSDWTLSGNGWILNGNDQRDLLLWVPPDLRRTLWRPRNTAVFSCEFSTQLNFSGVLLGEEWSRCFSPYMED